MASGFEPVYAQAPARRATDPSVPNRVDTFSNVFAVFRARASARELDLGERAAIALAASVHADLLLIDDAAGRAEAKRRNLRATGTLGVLRAAAELGLIDVPNVVSRLKANKLLHG